MNTSQATLNQPVFPWSPPTTRASQQPQPGGTLESLRRAVWAFFQNAGGEQSDVPAFDENRLLPLDGVRPEFLSSVRTLARLIQLPGNWDSYGSLPIQPPAYFGALWLLLVLNDTAVSAPHIGPVSDGGIQLEWQLAGRELELEILPDGTIGYLSVNDRGEIETGDVEVGDTAQVQLLTGQLLAQRPTVGA